MSSEWTDEKHEQARELCANATPGPWKWGWRDREEGIVESYVVLHDYKMVAETHRYKQGYDDACLIADARTLLPAALEEIERLQARVKDLLPALDTACDTLSTTVRELGLQARERGLLEARAARLWDACAKLEERKEGWRQGFREKAFAGVEHWKEIVALRARVEQLTEEVKQLNRPRRT